MTAKEYIESGMLEAYVMGALGDAERAEVENAASHNHEIKAELDAIEAALHKYAVQNAIEPSAELREKVLSRLSDSRQERDVVNINVQTNVPQDPRGKLLWSMAASVLLLISLGINIYLFNRSALTEKDNTAMTAHNHLLDSSVKTLTASMKKMTSDMDRYKSDMAILMDPMYKMVELKGMKIAPDAKAMVCWCPGSKLLYFETEKMPDPPKGMQYQLWAIVDGKPVDAGMIIVGAGMHKMKDIANAQSFAVTLEKEGGSDTPHGDMYVLGNI